MITKSDRTLQELIAPRQVFFYGQHWNFMGSSKGLVKTIAEYSNIHIDVLSGSSLPHSFSIAQRMSWAAYRYTSRIEDQAYCLLGIFGVNMPMLYGERERAFARLQEEIVRSTTDQSIFAWRSTPPACQYFSDVSSLLAKSPTDFRHGDNIKYRRKFQDRSTVLITQRGFDATLPLIEGRDGIFYALLNCTSRELDKSKRMALRIRPLTPSTETTPWVVTPSQDPADLGRLVLFERTRDEEHNQYRTITILQDIYRSDLYQMVDIKKPVTRPKWLNLGILDGSKTWGSGVHLELWEQHSSDDRAALTSVPLSEWTPPRVPLGDSPIRIRIQIGDGVDALAVVTLGTAYSPSTDEILPYEAQLSLLLLRRSITGKGIDSQDAASHAVRRYLWPIEVTYPIDHYDSVLRVRLSVPSMADRGHAWLEFGISKNEASWPKYTSGLHYPIICQVLGSGNVG